MIIGYKDCMCNQLITVKSRAVDWSTIQFWNQDRLLFATLRYEKDCGRVYQIKIDSTVTDTANSGSLHALFSEQA